jgi:hypothetical protein
VTQPSLLGPRGHAPPGDELGRVYTPMPLAQAIVGRLVDGSVGLALNRRPYVIEPSVGGGAFVRAARWMWPACNILGVDIDPHAEGLALCGDRIVGDWLSPNLSDRLGGLPIPADLGVGNPPFGKAVGADVTGRHVELTLERCTTVALLLPAGVLHQRAFRRAVARAGRPEPEVWPILGRVWDRVREVAVFVWGPDARPGTYRVLEF